VNVVPLAKRIAVECGHFVVITNDGLVVNPPDLAVAAKGNDFVAPSGIIYRWVGGDL
jgi:hypothetical protein